MVWVNNGSDSLDQDSNYPTILGTCIALPILTTIVVALRAYCRGKLLKTLYYDDYVIFFSAVRKISVLVAPASSVLTFIRCAE